MPTYAYRARNDLGHSVAGVLEAPTEEVADETLRARGLYVTAVTERVLSTEKKASPTLALTRRDLIVLTLHIATVQNSGIPIVEGLANFAREAPNRRLKAITLSLLEGISGGAALSDVMARYPNAFPGIYVHLVRAGETIGRVDAVLFDLVASLEWQHGLRAEIRQASIYPAMLLMTLTALAVGISAIVMPRFAAALTKAGVTLPTSTLLVVGFGEFVANYWLQLLLGMIATAVALRLLADVPRARYAIDWLKLQTPWVGELIRQVGLSRFAHHLRLMERGGVNFIVGLNVVEHVVGNQVLARAVAQARERVIAGSSLSEALRQTKQFPSLVLQMVATGETTGSLEETLKKVMEYYDREVPAAVKRITTVIEPGVYIILGAVVLGTALALYSPLLSMMQNLQGIRPRF